MTPKATAAIGLRLLGIWLILEAAFVASNAIETHESAMSGQPGVHRRFYDGNTVTTPSDNLSLQDTYYVLSDFTWDYVGAGLRVAVGLTLIFASKPLARLVAWKLDTF